MKLIVTYIAAVLLAVLVYGGVKALMPRGDEPAVSATLPSAPTVATAPQTPEVNAGPQVNAEVPAEATQTEAEAKAQTLTTALTDAEAQPGAKAEAETPEIRPPAQTETQAEAKAKTLTPVLSDAEAEKRLSGFPLERTYQAMLRYFPEQVAFLRELLPKEEQAKNTPETERDTHGDLFDKGIRLKYLGDISYAPDAVLKKLIGTFLEVVEPLRDDPRACAGYLLGGRRLTLQQAVSVLTQTDDFLATSVEAMYQGNTTPQNRGAVTAEIYTRLEQSLTAADKRLLDAGNIDDPRTCTALLTYLRTVQTAEFDGADVMRAEIALDMLGGDAPQMLRWPLIPPAEDAIPVTLPSTPALQQPQANAETETAADSDAELEALFNSSSFTLTYQAIKRHFPEEAALMRANVRELGRANVSQAAVSAAVAKIMPALHEKYGADAYFAPDPFLKQLIGRRWELFYALRDDPLACNRLFMQGEQSLTEKEQYSLPQHWDAISAGVVEAMYYGKTALLKRPPISQEIFDRMLDRLSGTYSSEDVRLMRLPDVKNPDSCAVYRLYLGMAQDADFEGADRLRAQMALDIQDGKWRHRLRWSATPQAVEAVDVPTLAPAPQKPQANAETGTRAPAEAKAAKPPGNFPLEQTYQAIKHYFPEDAAAMLASLREPKRSSSAGVTLAASLHKKYATDVYAAPDAALKKLMARHLAFLDALRADPGACARFLLEGELALTQQQQISLSEQSDALSAAVIEAMYSGRTEPQHYPPLTHQVSTLLAGPLGILSVEDSVLLIHPVADNPRSCVVHINYLKAVQTADFDGADALRAKTVQFMLEEGSLDWSRWSSAPPADKSVVAPSLPTPAIAPQKPQANAGTKTDADADAALEALFNSSSFTLTYQAIKRYFPEDAAAMRAKVSASAVSIGGAKFVASLHEKYAADVYFAPDAALKQYIGKHLAVLEMLRDDPRACAGLQLEGSGALTKQQQNLLSSQLDALSASLVEAMYQGRTTPQQRGTGSGELYTKLFNVLKQILTPEDLLLLVYPDAKNPRSCAVKFAYMQAAQTADFEGADVLRAEIAQQAAGGEGLSPQQTDEAAPSPSSPATAPQKPQPERKAEAQADAETLANAPSLTPFYDAMQKYFPQDAALTMAGIRKLRQANAPESEIQAEGPKIWASLYEKYGADAYFAPDEVLKKLIAERLAFFEVLRDDPRACAGFLLRGEQALTRQQQSSLIIKAGALSAASIEVMYHGRTTPQDRAPMSYGVYSQMIESLVDLLTQEDADLLDEPDVNNPRSCEVYRVYLQAALSADFDGADRLRAQMALDMQQDDPHRLRWPAKPQTDEDEVAPLPSSAAGTSQKLPLETREEEDANMRALFGDLSIDLTYEAVRQYFPEGKAMMMARYRELRRANVSQAEMRAQGARFTVLLREKYAAYIYFAPDAAVKKLLASRLALLEVFRKDPLSCNRVLMQGQSALTQQQQSSVASQSETLAAAAAAAVRQGRANPQKRTAVSKKTTGRLFTLLEKDLKDEDLILLTSPDVKNKRTCLVHRTFLRTLHAADFGEVKVLRAITAQEMLKN